MPARYNGGNIQTASMLGQILIVSLVFRTFALKARQSPPQSCGIIEFEASVSKLPCWLEGTCKAPGKGNVRFSTKFSGKLAKPKSLDDVIKVIKESTKVMIVGSGHTEGGAITPGQGNATLLSLWEGFRKVKLDTCNLQVTVGPGVTIQDLAKVFSDHKVSMQSWLLVKDISLIGLAASSAVGMVAGQPATSFADMVEAVSVVNGQGEVKHYKGRENTNLRAWTMSLGELGVIYEMTFKIVRDTYVVQSCSNYISFDEASQALDLGNEVFPETFSDVSGTDNQIPIQQLCGSLKRSLVSDGLPVGYEDVCKEPTTQRFQLDAITSIIKRASDFPQTTQKGLNLLRGLCKQAPGIIKTTFPKLVKMFPQLGLGDYPFYPEKGKIMCHKYSEMEATPTDWTMPDNMPYWMEIFVSPPEQHLFMTQYEEYTNLHMTEMTGIFVPWGRVKVAQEPHSYLEPITKNLIRNIVTLMKAPKVEAGSEQDTQQMDKFFKGLMCKLMCEDPKVTVPSYHIGCVFPRDLAESPGFHFPTQDNLEPFLSVEKQEDPENKFETQLGNTFKRRYQNLLTSPEADMCLLCG